MALSTYPSGQAARYPFPGINLSLPVGPPHELSAALTPSAQQAEQVVAVVPVQVLQV